MPTKEAKAAQLGIEIHGSRTDFRIPCPACSPHRRKKRDPCLHVTITSDTIQYHCFHCHEFKGALSDDRDDFRPARQARAQRAPALIRWW